MGNTSAELFSKAYIKQLHTVAAELLRKDNKLGGSITLPVKEGNEYKTYTIPFYMKDNFSFSLKNEWGEMLNISELQLFNNGLNMFLSLMNASQMTLQSKAMSAVSWQGSSVPEFSINTVFVCVSREYNPIEIIKVLSASCLPNLFNDATDPNYDEIIKKQNEIAGNVNSLTVGTLGVGADVARAVGQEKVAKAIDDNKKSIGDSFERYIKQIGMVAPLEFGLKDGGLEPKENSTLSLTIGDWFTASNLVVSGISNITFSKEVIAPISSANKNGSTDTYKGNVTNEENKFGFPVYVECTITFRPFSLVTADEFISYFVTKNDTLRDENGIALSDRVEMMKSDMNFKIK